ncbi:MAG: hypothetical protein LQ351_007629 [Letrouitia transgressa]|nr:MAG: hypothetical protein LQ351_007629 [Letrouitia transgressa]
MPATTDEPFPEPSEFAYTGQESPQSAAQAAADVSFNFVVDRIQKHESGRGAYFAFQLKRPVSVRIYSPSSMGGQVECSCEDYQRTRDVCAHIHVNLRPTFPFPPCAFFILFSLQWLYDGLRSILQGTGHSALRSESQDDIINNISGLYDLIGRQMPSLLAQLNSTHDEDESDTDESNEDSNSSDNNTGERSYLIRDILSVFDGHALSQEFGREFSELSTMGALPELYVPGNLAATIYRLAVRDEHLYKRLRKTVTHDTCAAVNFTKQGARAREAFRRFDHFVQHGPSEDSPGNSLNVPGCARVLRFTVDRIFQDLESRAQTGPLGSGVYSQVAEILVDILHDVCNRNRDVYDAASEPWRERNLYVYLIGDPPKFGSSTPSWMKDSFVVDRLHQIPTDEWKHLFERLANVLEQMHENMPDKGHPPLAYTKLAEIMQDYTSEAFEPSSSSMQRRPSDERGRKRPRRGQP